MTCGRCSSGWCRRRRFARRVEGTVGEGTGEVLADTITAHLRRWLASRGIPHRLARKGIESSGHLGRYRWVVERTVSWLSGCRRLHRRYERKPEHFLAFTAIAATLICHPKTHQVEMTS